MTITVANQPAADSVKAAYRSILFDLSLDVDAPVVYCDIYFNGVYYKSLSTTTPGLAKQFDILDACQEFLTKFLAANGASTIAGAPPVFLSCFCRFRGSSFNSDGTIDIEATEPVQGTGGTPPIAGTGVESNTFIVLNASLQHEDNQDLLTHASNFKTGMWDTLAWPLSHRKNGYKVIGSDYFPFLYKGSASLSCIKVTYKRKDGTTGVVNTCGAVYPNCPIISGVTIESADNGDGTQKFAINWDPADPLLSQIQIQYRVQGSSGAYTIVSVHLASYPTSYTIVLPLGLYQFRIRVLGACISQFTGTFDNKGIAAPICVPVTFHDAPELPDAEAVTIYEYDIPLLGTPPFSISNITAPAWVLGITIINGNTVQILGKPGKLDVANNVHIKFDITNGCGTQTIDQLIDVLWKNRTLTFTAVMGLGTYSQVVATLSGPVDEDFQITNMAAKGYVESTCIGEVEVATDFAKLKSIITGNTSVGGSDGPTGDWSTVNSYRISDTQLRVPSQGPIPFTVSPGDTVQIGTYHVFVVYGGCPPLSLKVLAENSDTLVTEAGDSIVQH